jgi:hypothetical protein
MATEDLVKDEGSALKQSPLVTSLPRNCATEEADTPCTHACKHMHTRTYVMHKCQIWCNTLQAEGNNFKCITLNDFSKYWANTITLLPLITYYI